VEEFLRQIPGPMFLSYYAVYALFCIFIGRKWLNRDSSRDTPSPAATYFDSISLSYLKSGRSGVIRTAVFILWNQGLIRIGGTGSAVTIERTKLNAGDTVLTMKAIKPVVKLIYQFLDFRTLSRDLFKSPELKRNLDIHLQFVKRELTELHLFLSRDDRFRSVLVFICVLFVMVFPGIFKLHLGIVRHKPVGFLLGLLVISVITVFRVLNPGHHCRPLGRNT
jgi:uncharacterized protein (TIGR04222 family)